VTARETVSAAYAVNSEPPSVKLREVYDVIQESNPPRWSSQAEPYVVKTSKGPRKPHPDYIKAFEETELPPRSRKASDQKTTDGTSAGKQEDSQEKSSKQKGRREETYEVETIYYRHKKGEDPEFASEPASAAHQARSNSTKANYRDEWDERDTVRTTEVTSRRQDKAPSNSGPSRQAEQSKASNLPMSALKQPAGDGDSVQSDKTRWSKDQVDAEWGQASDKKSGQKASNAKTSLPYPEEDVMPDHDSSAAAPRRAKSSKADRSGRKRQSDIEYIYTECIVTPADRPRGWRPPHTLTMIDEELRRERRPTGRDRSPR
jgi:hypothetical protein